jgi:glycosyltransferase involved in cell wall biosynthesis
MPAPLISVITIFLNAERFISEAIESVLSQTYQAWELLLVDDGSSDRSTEIALHYTRQHPGRIRYLVHEGHQNRGMSASRNLGLRASRGDYVAFLDADDVYLPGKLDAQLRALEARPSVAMVYGYTLHWYSWTGRPEDLGRDEPRRIGIAPGTVMLPPALAALFLRDRHQVQTPCTCGVLVRREAVEAVGGFEEQFAGLFEDQAFFFKICVNFPVLVDGGTWDRYRQHDDSYCLRRRSAGDVDPLVRPNVHHETFLRWLQRYVSDKRIVDDELSLALSNELWPYDHPHLYGFGSHLATVSRRLRKVWRRI